MTLKKSQTMTDITEGVLWKQILMYFFPILLGTFFQQMYNTIDAVVVGKFVGTQALAAVGGTAGTLINLLIGFFNGLASGATVILAQYYGSRDEKNASYSVHTAFALSIAGGLILMAIGIPFSRAALGFMNTPDDVIDLSATYMRIYFVGVIPSLIYNIGSGILRAVGDSRRPLYFLIICSFANIVLDLFFVLVLKLGVAGVAIATVLSQTISAALVIITLMRSEGSFRLFPQKIRFHGEILRRIIVIGLPAGLQSVLYSVSNIVLQASVNAFGTTVIAAYTAYGKLDGMLWMLMGAFGVTVTTFVGQNFGAQKFKRMRASVRWTLVLTLIATLLLEMLIYFFARPMLGLFSEDAAVIAEGARITRYLAPTYVLYLSVEILSGALRGTGDSLAPMLMTSLGICGIRVLWVLFGRPYFDDVLVVLTSYPVTWGITSALYWVYYLFGGWLKRRKKAMGFSLEENE